MAAIPIVGIIVSAVKYAQEERLVQDLLSGQNADFAAGLELGFHRLWRGFWCYHIISSIVLLFTLPITLLG